MALKQDNRLMTIRTKLDGTNLRTEGEHDHFVPIAVSGAEAISAPYSYDVTLLTPGEVDVDPQALVGTRAKLGIRMKAARDGYTPRFGIIESFESMGRKDDHRFYRARIVPAFALTGYEVRYRVFEEMTLKEILRDVLLPYGEIETNTSWLDTKSLPRIPYCVQFGESTLDFLHRLLARFGVFYSFDHEWSPQREVINFASRGFQPSAALPVVLDEKLSGAGVASLHKSFKLAVRKMTVGNFSEINPVTPYRGKAEIAAAYDVAGHQPIREVEAFPVPATMAPEPENYAKERMRSNEGGVVIVTGQTKDPWFRPGRAFVVEQDKTRSGEERSRYLIRTLTFSAQDQSPLTTTGADIFHGMLAVLGISPLEKEDISGSMAASILAEVAEAGKTASDLHNWLNARSSEGAPAGLPYLLGKVPGTAGSVLGTATSVLGAVISAAKLTHEIAKQLEGKTGFSAAFEALPLRAPGPDRDARYMQDLWPTPRATRPAAQGPHLATVIGPNGLNTAQHDVWADALGRVRIRFPWDPGPSPPGDPLGEDPWMTGRNTCWVRVAEGWAGERFGHQFLPRIGQEVVVAFVDGDPERPLIVGRTYNARGGRSNLPFLPAAAAAKGLYKPADLQGTASSEFYRSGIRTRSTPAKPEGKSGFHMMRLDDKRGAEQFLLRSQCRMDITALCSRHDTTRGNLHMLVGGKHEEDAPAPGGAMFTTVGGSYDLHIGKERYENTDGPWQMTVKGAVTADVKGEWRLYDKAPVMITAPSLIVQASERISLRVGNSRIVITPATIFLDAAMIRNNSGSSPVISVPDAEMTDAADAAPADPGDPADWLARQPKGAGGGRRTHKATASAALGVFRAPDGKIHVGNPKAPVPGRITIDDRDPDFAEGVANDLNRLAHTDEGFRKYDALNKGSKPVVISKPGAKTDPPGAGTAPDDIADATQAGQPTGRQHPDGTPEQGTGKGSGTTIHYDPKDWPRKNDPNSPDGAKVLDGLLDNAAQDTRGEVPPNGYSGAVPPKPPPAPPAGSGAAPGSATPAPAPPDPPTNHPSS